MNYDKTIIDIHVQKYNYSCIPSCVEMILKLLGLVSFDFYELQDEWGNRKDGSFADFDSKTYYGITFWHKFSLPRGERFPLEDLFQQIDKELDDGRQVCVSLQMNNGYHMFVTCAKKNSEYIAFSKDVSHTIEIRNTRQRIERMRGTDILIYRIADD